MATAPEDVLAAYSQTIEAAVQWREIRRFRQDAYENLESVLWLRLKRRRKARKQTCGDHEVDHRIQRLRARKGTALCAAYRDWQSAITETDRIETMAREAYMKCKDREYAYWSGKR